MYMLFEGLISPEDCNSLNEKALEYKNKNLMNFEGGDAHYANSFGIAQIPEYEQLLHKLTPFIIDQTQYKNITAENSYTRIYYNGSRLRRHVDRTGLDLTLSVCTFSNIGKPWPLYAEISDGEVKSFDLKVGDGAIILGTKMPHWRDDLVCQDDQYIIQSFYHWKINTSLKFV